MWLKILNQSWSFVAKLSSQPRWVPLLLGSITLFLIPSIYSCLLPSGMVSSGRWRVIFSFPDCMLLQILSSSLNLLITHLPPLNWLGDALSDELHSHHSFFFFFSFATWWSMSIFCPWTLYFLSYHCKAGHYGKNLWLGPLTCVKACPRHQFMNIFCIPLFYLFTVYAFLLLCQASLTTKALLRKSKGLAAYESIGLKNEAHLSHSLL